MGFEVFKKILEMVQSVSEKQKTEHYRGEVLNDLQEIETQLGTFFEDFKKFEVIQEFNDMLDSIGWPIRTSANWYVGDSSNNSVTGWLKGLNKGPDPTIKSDIEAHAESFLRRFLKLLLRRKRQLLARNFG